MSDSKTDGLQILHYTDTDDNSKLTDHALRTSEKILGPINEIRAQEGRDYLRELSQDRWIGNECVTHSPSMQAFLT